MCTGARDLLRVFGENTNATLAAATQAAEAVLTREGCVDPHTDTTDWHTAKAIGAELHASSALLPRRAATSVAAARSNSTGLLDSTAPAGKDDDDDGVALATGTGNIALAAADYLALPTVYHKLMLMCVPRASLTQRCPHAPHCSATICVRVPL